MTPVQISARSAFWAFYNKIGMVMTNALQLVSLIINSILFTKSFCLVPMVSVGTPLERSGVPLLAS
jgi:hypothetical protein